MIYNIETTADIKNNILINRHSECQATIKFSEAKKDDFVLHEMGNHLEFRHVKRSILGNVVLEDGTRTKKEYLGYRADRGEHSHEELTTSRVNDFLDKLREKIRK